MPSRSTTTSVLHVHQNDMKSQRAHPQARLTDPDPGARSSDGKRATASSGSVTRSTPRTAPPSAPLPPLPLETSPLPAHTAKPLRQSPGPPTQVSTRNPRKSTAETQDASAMGADVAHNTSAFHPSVSRPKPLGESRRSHNQGVGEEFGEKVLPESYARPHKPPPDVVPAPPPKSGLLKRLTTRLGGTRSSPSLRPTATSPEVASKVLDTLHPHREEDESPGSNTISAPARYSPPIPNQKGRLQPPPQQSLNARLSLAALAEKRADRREVRARDEQRATDLRRAAALAERGLLPASRRYSAVPALANGHAFDPFAKDGVQQERGSGEGVEVESGSGLGEVREEGESGLSAAEVVIREWRERNARANGMLRSTAPNDVLQSSNADVGKAQIRDTTRVASSPMEASSTPEPPALSDPEALPSVSRADRGLSPSSPARPSSSTNFQAPASTPAVVDSIPHGLPELHGTEKPTATHVRSTLPADAAPKPNGQLSPLPPPPSKKKPRTAAMNAVAKDQDPKDARTVSRERMAGSTKVEANEKAALGAWRFPATVTSAVQDSSGLATPRGEKAPEGAQPSSPASPRSVSSVSTAVADRNNSQSPHSEDAPPPPPPKPKKVSVTEHGKKEENTVVNTRNDTHQAQTTQAPSSPAQAPLPVSSTILPVHSLETRSRARSSTAPPASQTPTAPRVRAQKQPNAPPTPSQAPSLSLPALSPTTSTGTSTSSGSALPRTPSTSSHGHSPVCVLDAPLEDEEDALLSDEAAALASVAAAKSEVNGTGVKEFGELANLAELDPEAHEVGALPPLPPSSFRDPSHGAVATPVVEGACDQRRRTTLFGRRRIAQNCPPMIAIPEKVAGLTAAGRLNGTCQDAAPTVKPRHASSFTNLRRTVTSVTAGLTGAAGAGMRVSSKTPSAPPHTSTESVPIPQKKASFPGCGRVPLRGATMPSPRPLASPRSNTSGTNSLSRTSTASASSNQRSGPGVGLRVQPLNPTMHSRGSILLEAHAIEDEESRRLSELAFLD